MKIILPTILISFLWATTVVADTIISVPKSMRVQAQKLPVTNPRHPIIVQKTTKQLMIVLNSNPTTGYTWFVTQYDNNLFKVKNKQYLPTSNLIGGGGQEQWCFAINSIAHKPGKTSISFEYRRPWEKYVSSRETFIVILQ